MGEGPRAALAALALVTTALVIYAIFSSGFGRPPRAALPSPAPAPAPVPVPPGPPTPGPSDAGTGAGGAAGGPRPEPLFRPVLAVVADDLWLTYLPPGLERRGGGAVAAGPGVDGGASARYASPDGFVEAQVERGTVAADWDGYRKRLGVREARAVTVRGRPAVVGRHPGGGRVIAWLERAGTAAWIRVSDALGAELAAIAASARTRVGD